MPLPRRFPPMILRATLSLLAVVILVAPVAAFPKPAAIPYRWQLQFEPGEIRLYQDRSTGDVYWYFTYAVTNRTGRTQLWAPRLTLFTDAGEIIVSGDSVPSRVEQEILDLLADELLEPQHRVFGDILVGPEHARDGLAIWPARNDSVNRLSLFIRGISGESTRITNPLTGEPVVLYKTLQRDYLIPGNALARGSEPVELIAEQWILR